MATGKQSWTRLSATISDIAWLITPLVLVHMISYEFVEARQALIADRSDQKVYGDGNGARKEIESQPNPWSIASGDSSAEPF
jgi:hypothetical protein